MKRLRLVALVAALLAVSFTLRTPVVAHARLVRAEPAPGSVVRMAPQVVRLWFALGGEELDPQRSTVSVWDRRGRRVDDGKGGVDLNDLDRRSMVARLPQIGPGTYTVRWKAVSVPDGNAAEGRFQFTVRK
ncbi:MAG: copper resistance protein CopC [Armatimonadota bacterium]|nr:copper resistance protein CopC [Armatimonadota bacterium]